MAFIMIENLFKKTLHVTNHSKTLLKHFQDNGMDWMHACGGKGRCTTCKVIIKAGEEHFQELTAAELKYFRDGGLTAHERLACQAIITGDVCVIAPKEYQLPHIRYSDKA